MSDIKAFSDIDLIALFRGQVTELNEIMDELRLRGFEVEFNVIDVGHMGAVKATLIESSIKKVQIF